MRLGPLEHEILELLWGSADALSVREVCAALKPRRKLAYTTVLTVLDRLHDKQAVSREKVGRSWTYRPTQSREQWLGQRAAALLEADEAVLAAFLDSAERIEPDLIDRLAAQIRARRRRRK